MGLRKSKVQQAAKHADKATSGFTKAQERLGKAVSLLSDAEVTHRQAAESHLAHAESAKSEYERQVRVHKRISDLLS